MRRIRDLFRPEPAEETFRCPRRDENPSSDTRFPGPDRYTPNHGVVTQPRGCSYCGSMSPADLLEALDGGAEIGPSDKSYKFYVENIPLKVPAQLRYTSSANHPGAGLRPYAELTREEKAAVDRGWGRFPEVKKAGYYGGFTTATVGSGKFYTHHFGLTPDLAVEFRRRWLAGELAFGYPGHFYRRLYLPLPEDYVDPPMPDAPAAE